MLERAATAREAIRIGGSLIEKYGWCDEGEALTIADPQEVWLMEIVGPGEDEVGAVWAAQRVPDDHVSVVANAARIGAMDLSDSRTTSWPPTTSWKSPKEHGYWDPARRRAVPVLPGLQSGRPHELCVHAARMASPGPAGTVAATAPNSNVFPFSVKPEQPVGPEKIMELLS